MISRLCAWMKICWAFRRNIEQNEFLGYLKNRIEAIEDGYLEIFMHTDLQTQKIINILASAKKNRLFFEFLWGISWKKWSLEHSNLRLAISTSFLKTNKSKMKLWRGLTHQTITQYIWTFVDAGLLTVSDKKQK